jgi:hypothetical protein
MMMGDFQRCEVIGAHNYTNPIVIGHFGRVSNAANNICKWAPAPSRCGSPAALAGWRPLSLSLPLQICQGRAALWARSQRCRPSATPSPACSVLDERTWGDSCDDVLRMAELPRERWKQCHIPRHDIVVPPAQHESPLDPPPFFADPSMAQLRWAGWAGGAAVAVWPPPPRRPAGGA